MLCYASDWLSRDWELVHPSSSHCHGQETLSTYVSNALLRRIWPACVRDPQLYNRCGSSSCIPLPGIVTMATWTCCWHSPYSASVSSTRAPHAPTICRMARRVGKSRSRMELTLIADTDQTSIGWLTIGIHIAQSWIIETILLFDAYVTITAVSFAALARVLRGISMDAIEKSTSQIGNWFSQTGPLILTRREHSWHECRNCCARYRVWVCWHNRQEHRLDNRQCSRSTAHPAAHQIGRWHWSHRTLNRNVRWAHTDRSNHARSPPGTGRHRCRRRHYRRNLQPSHTPVPAGSDDRRRCTHARNRTQTFLVARCSCR